MQASQENHVIASFQSTELGELAAHVSYRLPKQQQLKVFIRLEWYYNTVFQPKQLFRCVALFRAYDLRAYMVTIFETASQPKYSILKNILILVSEFCTLRL